MLFSNSCKLSPLAKAVSVITFTPLLFISPSAMALSDTVLPGQTKNIDSTEFKKDWAVMTGATLNAVGASIASINAANNAVVSLTGSNVDATGSTNALLFAFATGVLNGSNVSGGQVGARISQSTVTATDSTISGIASGALLAVSSVLNLSNSTVSGVGSGGVGIQMAGGQVNATNGSVISGVQNGVVVAQGTGGNAPELNLDNSRVEGQTGSAIVLDSPLGSNNLVTQINVLNGSTLSGGNGTMLEVNGVSGAMNVRNSTLAGNVEVRNSGNVSLSLDQSQMTGDVVAEAGSTADVVLANQSVLTGRLENLNSLTVNSAAQWVMVEDSTVANLAMDGGTVKMGDPAMFYTLSVGNLSGNGTFVMDADFSQGKVDFLDVTGTATGSHSLLVGASGADPVTDTALHVVHIASGDAKFSLLNGPVDVGTYSYDLKQVGSNDWYLDADSRTISPSTGAVLALFNTAPTVWYGELSTLRSRMGELRTNGGQSGGWVRAYGNKYDASAASGVGYQQTQQGISFGADAPLPYGDGQWLIGLLGGYSKSDLDLDRGTSGTVKSYYVGAYTTWLDKESGYYFDGVLKLNRFSNEADVSMSDGTQSKGDYDNSGVGASAEFGKHIELANDYFVEPYTQLSGVVIQGKDYHLDNGLNAEGDRTHSLLGKLGTTVGRNFNLGEGKVVQPYVRAAYVHEFAKNNDVNVNDNVFNNDLSGSRGELGTGIAVSLSDKWQVHADLEYSKGDKLEQPWGGNIGLRYSW